VLRQTSLSIVPFPGIEHAGFGHFQTTHAEFRFRVQTGKQITDFLPLLRIPVSSSPGLHVRCQAAAGQNQQPLEGQIAASMSSWHRESKERDGGRMLGSPAKRVPAQHSRLSSNHIVPLPPCPETGCCPGTNRGWALGDSPTSHRSPSAPNGTLPNPPHRPIMASPASQQI
jgi:hypothetical protein